MDRRDIEGDVTTQGRGIVKLDDVDPAEVEPGIFEVEAPVSELADLNAYVRQLA